MSINEIKPGDGRGKGPRWWIQVEGITPDFHDATNLTIYRDGPWCSFTTKGGNPHFTQRPVLIREEVGP